MIGKTAMTRLSGLCLMVGVACLLVGCRGGELNDRADRLSSERLDGLPAAATVLLSLHGGASPPPLPPLGEGGRTVSESGGAALVVAARGLVAGLARLEGVERIVVWGDGARAGRLESRLRDDILVRLDADRDDETLPVIATFAGDAPDLIDELSALGARVGSRSGSIVTLEAAPQALLRVFARDDLVKLEKPELQRPSAPR